MLSINYVCDPKLSNIYYLQMGHEGVSSSSSAKELIQRPLRAILDTNR